MITRDQDKKIHELNQNSASLFYKLPYELVDHISQFGHGRDSEFNIALRLAASSIEEDMIQLVKMVKKNPRLLLQAGDVVTRGGVHVIRTTLYEFFLCAGDPAGAKRIEFGFAKLSKDGKKERLRQCERCRPYIEALARQVELKMPVFDLKSLFDMVKQSTPDDIRAALDKDMTHESALRDALVAFRDAVRPKKKSEGMHYEHYTTLLQAYDLLYKEWEELSSNHTNYDKCDLIWRQIIGYLQRSLPAVDRFGLGCAFTDEERTLKFKYGGNATYPDSPDAEGDLDLTGLGFDNGICASGAWRAPREPRPRLVACLEKHMSNKNARLTELILPHHRETKTARCVVC